MPFQDQVSVATSAEPRTSPRWVWRLSCSSPLPPPPPHAASNSGKAMAAVQASSLFLLCLTLVSLMEAQRPQAADHAGWEVIDRQHEQQAQPQQPAIRGEQRGQPGQAGGGVAGELEQVLQ